MISIKVCIYDRMGPYDVLRREIPISFELDDIPCKPNLKMNKYMFANWLFDRIEETFPVILDRKYLENQK
jgi:hypothetical protein